jgi:hypothetical protein
MSMFEEREKAFESKFAHDEDLRFRAKMLRNKLFAQWAARKLGLTGAEAEDYASFVVKTEVSHPGDAKLVETVFDGLKAAGMQIQSADIQAKLAEFAAEALNKVKTEVRV